MSAQEKQTVSAPVLTCAKLPQCSQTRASRFAMSLTPDQIHILVNAVKSPKMSPASQLIGKPHLRVKDVRELYALGFLDCNGRNYGPNAKTERALAEAGFDVAELIETRNESTGSQPKKEIPQDILEKIREVRESGFIEVDNRVTEAALLETARYKARGGKPWDWIKLQWPELVITDPIDLKYFKKYCTRTEALDIRIDDRQYDLIRHALDPRRVKEIGIKGSTSPGKGFATALLVNIWYDIYTEDRIVLMGPSSQHAKTVMFSEVSEWRRKMRHTRKGEELQAEGIKDSNNKKHTILISNPEAGESISGMHGSNTLYVLDEASNIPDEMYVSAQKPARLIVGISNPRILSGWFRSWFPNSDPDANQVIIDRGIRRALLTFGGPDCLNVKANRLNEYEYSPVGGIEITDLDDNVHRIAEGDPIPDELIPHVRALIPRQMDVAKYRSIMMGRDEIVRCWSGDGKFPPEDLEFQVCPPSWLKLPFREWELHHDQIKVTSFGLDVAMSLNGDETVLMSGGTRGILRKHTTHKANVPETAMWVIQTVINDYSINLRKGGHPVAVDVIGVGGGVADKLEELGVMVTRVWSSKTAEDPKLFMNTRAELYGNFAERIDPEGQFETVFMLPPDNDLEVELAAHEKEYDRDMSRYRVTPKRRASGNKSPRQSIQERLGRSPDTSDAAVLCYLAIRQTDEDSTIGEQFRPTQVLQSYSETRDGTIFVTLANGVEKKMTKEEFAAEWGASPPTVQETMSFYENALSTVSFYH